MGKLSADETRTQERAVTDGVVSPESLRELAGEVQCLTRGQSASVRSALLAAATTIEQVPEMVRRGAIEAREPMKSERDFAIEERDALRKDNDRLRARVARLREALERMAKREGHRGRPLEGSGGKTLVCERCHDYWPCDYEVARRVLAQDEEGDS